jgi:hypothetical protein
VLVFSIGLARFKYRWMAMPVNLVFALLLFSSLTTVFYMRNCDLKSAFRSESSGGASYYLDGHNYFVNFNMEPYLLTNPRAYPDLALNNVSDTHLREWMLKYCPFSPPPAQPAPEKK